jgi:hypothetical protein
LHLATQMYKDFWEPKGFSIVCEQHSFLRKIRTF